MAKLRKEPLAGCKRALPEYNGHTVIIYNRENETEKSATRILLANQQKFLVLFSFEREEYELSRTYAFSILRKVHMM